MTNKEYFDRLAEYIQALYPKFDIAYTNDFRCWRRMSSFCNRGRYRSFFYYPIEYILYGKMTYNGKERNDLYLAVADTLLHCDEAFLGWGETQGMINAIRQVCYEDLVPYNYRVSKALQRYRHCCLTEALFNHRDIAQISTEDNKRALNIYIPYGYAFCGEYKKKYRECTEWLLGSVQNWTSQDWLYYNEIRYSLSKGEKIAEPMEFNESIDAVYHRYFISVGFDGKIEITPEKLITAKNLPVDAFERFFGNEDNLYAYVRGCMEDKNCKLTPLEYQSGWIYKTLEKWTEDREGSRYHDAIRLMFDINTTIN